jgi:hypothetical protein
LVRLAAGLVRAGPGRAVSSVLAAHLVLLDHARPFGAPPSLTVWGVGGHRTRETTCVWGAVRVE